jgi:hypothetical protein
MTLAVREAAVDATMMGDTTLCLQVSKKKTMRKNKKTTTEQNEPRS